MKPSARPFHFGLGWAIGGLLSGWGYFAVLILLFGHRPIGGWSLAAVVVLCATLEALLGFVGAILTAQNRLLQVGRRRALLIGGIAGAIGMLVLCRPLAVVSSGSLMRLVLAPIVTGGALGLIALLVVGVQRKSANHGVA